MRRPRDFQRSRVYAWETKLWARFSGKTLIDLDEAQALADRVCDEHAQPRVRLRIHRGRVRGAYVRSPMTRPEIRMAPWAMFPAYVLHEVAHHLDRHGGDASHGPTFVRRLVTLLRTYLGWKFTDPKELQIAPAVVGAGALMPIAAGAGTESTMTAKTKKQREKKAPPARKRIAYPAQTMRKTYKGREYVAKLAADGTCVVEADGWGSFEFGSLTAAALDITGAGNRGKRISGPAFFGARKDA